jgi:dCTP deaminase
VVLSLEMALTHQPIEKMISSPSIGAITYQARALIRELERMTEKEYLPQACRIKDVFLCIIDYVLGELTDLQEITDVSPASETTLARVRALGSVLHDIYSYIRYLWASSPLQSPPGVQVALTQLTEMYFPKENGDPVSVVRPQWKYNLTYVPMSWQIKEALTLSVLDPNGKLGARNPEELLKKLWERNPDRASGRPVPTQLAILSFAGLDTHDTLLYPLLAHELGHFIDFSFTPPLNLRTELRQKAEIRAEQVSELLQQIKGSRPDAQEVSGVLNRLVQQVFVAIREIIADLFATRMLGFATFVAQAEFLKTLAPWPQPVITLSGYPGLRFRLQIIFEHLVQWLPSCLEFFKIYANSRREVAEPLIHYMELWTDRLKLSTTKTNAAVGLGQAQFAGLVENAVRAVLPDLHQLVKDKIPDARAARLTEQFFDRIERLHLDLPPSCPSESPNCFAEILSAGWAYQIVHGAWREATTKDSPLRFNEHEKTCRLLLKAIEMTSTGASGGEAVSTSFAEFPTVPEAALEKGGVLGMPHIATRLQLGLRHPKRLDVTPLNTRAIQTASLDVHLGHWFAVARRVRTASVRLGEEKSEKLLMTVGRELIFIPPYDTFVIHPGDLVLGATLEFVALPADVLAFVEGRSGLGRRGLIVATATQVAPGFHGVIVLEMANAGTIPLELTPGMPVAQLVLQGLTEAVPPHRLYKGKYYCQVHP